MSEKTLKHIVVDERNYVALKALGHAGDSFNDVISKILKSNMQGPKEDEYLHEMENRLQGARLETPGANAAAPNNSPRRSKGGLEGVDDR